MRAPDGSSFKVTKGAAAAVLRLIDTNPEVTQSAVNRKARAAPLALGHAECLACLAYIRQQAADAHVHVFEGLHFYVQALSKGNLSEHPFCYACPPALPGNV